jgi:hypothetical protein
MLKNLNDLLTENINSRLQLYTFYIYTMYVLDKYYYCGLVHIIWC